ncbi:prepilin-type N-terminal cleavage/methylation domain-containing protein [Globicatella sulfidifaciens]|uniref:Prepilin-type N-terminal cleavage/methylation domain-containing protein n=1 Tax=Globicatella sulfidifaciens TaxID=136093 RepID=A0A7X8C619_9LACT|nr:prepilin-type N-terminal cleavage/methylation domain-containing protein [Globicatella sulfidifaciens]NLJ19320.1 prepilin-type N-terminal cleavage/methylation domain-containing protein [Globicatella sulfidifaciens]
MKTGKSEKGFTLIEILASISLITIIIIAVSTAFINYANFTKILENKLTSVHVAEELVTVIKNNDELAQLLNSTNEYNTGCATPKQVPLNVLPSVSAIYELNNSQYKPTISICQSTDEEKQLGLYRVKIDIANTSGTDQASLFTYFHLGSEIE